MSSPSMNSTDPNHWVTNPPQTFVKIQNIANRIELNGQFGLVIQYVADKSRYTIVRCNSQKEILSLKQENLAVCAGMMDKATAYYQMMKYNLELQQHIQRIHSYLIETILVPLRIVPQKVEYFYGMLSLLLFISWYLFGMTKLVIVVSIAVFVLSLIGKEIIDGETDLKTIFLIILPIRYKEMIQTQIPYKMGDRITSKPLYLRTFTFLLLGFLVYTLFGTPTKSMYFNRNSNRNKQSMTSTDRLLLNTDPEFQLSSSSSPETLLSKEQQDYRYYYKLGFDDATSGVIFGKSMHEKSDEESTLDVQINDDGTTTIVPIGTAGNRNDIDRFFPEKDDNTRYYENDPRIYDGPKMPIKKSVASSLFSFSTMMAFFTMYRILQPIIAMSINNNTGSLDMNLLRANCMTHIDLWKGVILAFSVYRIVIIFM